jgi:hypothetical protein
MYWVLLLSPILASLASLTTGIFAAIFCCIAYSCASVARQRRIVLLRFALVLFAPLVGVFVGALIFLAGPGF